MKPSLRTKSVGTKVSEPEFAALKATARAAEMTLSEWVRAVLLSAPGVELPEDGAALAGRVAVTEVLALRTILINLVFSLGKGEPMTHEQMQALIERADGGKAKRVLERLDAARLEAARTPMPTTTPCSITTRRPTPTTRSSGSIPTRRAAGSRPTRIAVAIT